MFLAQGLGVPNALQTVKRHLKRRLKHKVLSERHNTTKYTPIPALPFSSRTGAGPERGRGVAPPGGHRRGHGPARAPPLRRALAVLRAPPALAADQPGGQGPAGEGATALHRVLLRVPFKIFTGVSFRAPEGLRCLGSCSGRSARRPRGGHDQREKVPGMDPARIVARAVAGRVTIDTACHELQLP